ncbi:NADPH:quinone oxidoreductase family protein [Tropicimonas isoalkanivorans]|uniref:NADPH2:quinone reductase n=1 Tax=Tropicimonas isoalkanivorans TaxID=441112 RepID=A0A1I1HRT6_9RHOB|nr:NADPH:quinone oxidoreductase family protein [Tropicimonas isoalkanivorans]SFC26644.1 NADPH2:quinone reductase [Tropicimonas isoalkanivorans]
MTLPETMEALVVRNYGDWRDAAIEQVPVPQPGAGEVLIRSGGAALNFPDLLMIEGGYQVKPTLPFVPGRDIAGEVVALGQWVEGVSIGDRVAAQPPFGAFAEYAAVPAHTCVPLPDGVSFANAAATGTVIATVVAAIKLRLDLQPGETVLVTGAAGGVGSMALQYARLLGATPIALVSSDEKVAAALRLGAGAVVRSDRIGDPVRGLRAGLDAAGIGQVDAVIDMVGGVVAEGALRSLKPGGRFAIVGFAGGAIQQIPANYVLLKDLVVYGSSLDRLFRTRDAALLDALDQAFAALADGRLKAEIDRTLPLSSFAEGAARIAGREAIGKILFRIGERT